MFLCFQDCISSMFIPVPFSCTTVTACMVTVWELRESLSFLDYLEDIPQKHLVHVDGRPHACLRLLFVSHSSCCHPWSLVMQKQSQCKLDPQTVPPLLLLLKTSNWIDVYILDIVSPYSHGKDNEYFSELLQWSCRLHQSDEKRCIPRQYICIFPMIVVEECNRTRISYYVRWEVGRREAWSAMIEEILNSFCSRKEFKS